MQNEKRNDVRKSIIENYKELNSTCDIAKIVIISCVLSGIAFILDYYNIPSRYIKMIPMTVIYVMLALALIVAITLLMKFHIVDLFRIIAVNSIETIILTVIFSAIGYSLVSILTINNGVYIVISNVICVTSFLIILVRFIIRCVKTYKSYNVKSNLIDFKDLYDNNFVRVPNKPILMFEKDVDYDLLNRDVIIKHLYNSITHCQPYQSYVISLEGEWGSGKTTIINNVKRLLQNTSVSDKNYICIDDFDPWLYETQEAILLAMLESIVHHSGIHYSPSRFNSITQGICETVSNSHWSGDLLLKLFQVSANNGNNVLKLKQKIARCLRVTDKNIVFFIDNVDRAKDENIVFLFKLISIVFDLPRMIYVLSFERERVNNVLRTTDSFDERFIEKIIQQEIKVPPISEETTNNVYYTCFKNLLSSYGVLSEDKDEYIPSARYILGKTRNVREFKRMVNSVFPSVFGCDVSLNKSDLFMIEAIRFYDPELFYTIYKNSKYFISHDRDFRFVMKHGYDKESFNTEGRNFFKTLFLKHADAIDLLSASFPYVERYKNHQELDCNNRYTDPEYIQISRQSRICSSKYFDLYFSYTKNDCVAIRENIESMILEINETVIGEDLPEISKIVKKYLSVLKKEDHKEWVSQLQNYVSTIEGSSVYYLSGSLYILMNYFDDNSDSLGFALSARRRAEYIISLLLKKCTEIEFDNFISLVEKDYAKLYSILRIHSFMESDELKQSQLIKIRTESLWSCITNICDEIIREDVCLFDDPYYCPKNIWGFYHHCKQEERLEIFTTYIENHLTGYNIYRMLWDITSVTLSDCYTYYISQDNFDLYIKDCTVVDRLIEQRPPETEDEKIVFRIYEKFRDGEIDSWGHKGVTSVTYRDLTL